eukprot:792799-Alexandrium_andersonii.AAC.1
MGRSVGSSDTASSANPPAVDPGKARANAMRVTSGPVSCLTSSGNDPSMKDMSTCLDQRLMCATTKSNDALCMSNTATGLGILAACMGSISTDQASST